MEHRKGVYGELRKIYGHYLENRFNDYDMITERKYSDSTVRRPSVSSVQSKQVYHIKDVIRPQMSMNDHTQSSNLDPRDDIIQELSCQVAVLLGVNKGLKRRIVILKEQNVLREQSVQKGDFTKKDNNPGVIQNMIKTIKDAG